MSITEAFPRSVDYRNVDNYIYKVIDTTMCNRHQALKGDPCYSVTRDSSSIPSYGICNKRAVRAGMNGHISEQAVQSARNNRMHYAKDLSSRIRSKNFPTKSKRSYA